MSYHSILESTRMDTTLQWFLDHRHSLAHRDQYLLQYSTSDIPTIPPRTKRELVRLLEMAQVAQCQDSATREPGQTALTDYFTYPVKPRE